MKILHTSDWHLGKSFKNFNLLEDQRAVLQQFTALVTEYKPDVILLAGDIFDRSVPPAEAVQLFNECMTEIILRLQIPVIAIAGNHDSPERIDYFTGLLKYQGLHIIGQLKPTIEPVVLTDAEGEVYFYPIPYLEPEMLRERGEDDAPRTHAEALRWVIAQIKAAHPVGKRAVLMAHAFVAGGEESDSERQLFVGGATSVPPSLFADFDYVALGHLHKPQAVKANMRYSGSLLKYSFSEATHEKSVVLVELNASQTVCELLPLPAQRDVRRISGHIADGQFELAADQPAVGTEDFLEVTLHNPHPVLNAMQIVQQHYPNTLSLKWASQHIQTQPSQLNTEQLEVMQEIELFNAFYENLVQQPLASQHLQVLETVINTVKDAQA